MGDSPPPIGLAWDGDTPEEWHQRINEQNESARRRRIRPTSPLVGHSMQHEEVSEAKREINMLKIELENALKFVENERLRRQKAEREYNHLVDQFKHQENRIDELSQQLSREREIGKIKTENLNEYGVKLEEKSYEIQTLKDEYNTLEKEYETLELKYNKVLTEFDNISSES